MMPYIAVRIFSAASPANPEELSALAIGEVAPKLAAIPGFMRYATIAFADGRYGSFSAYESQDAARQGQKIAVEWVKGHSAMKGAKLDDTMEGDQIYAEVGQVPMKAPLYGNLRIYTTSASSSEIKDLFEKELGSTIREFTGLARYSVAKLTDGRVGVFNAFDTKENAAKSSEEAKKVRATTGSQVGRLLPSDPQTLECTVLGIYAE
jgi:hypothetical protein